MAVTIFATIGGVKEVKFTLFGVGFTLTGVDLTSFLVPLHFLGVHLTSTLCGHVNDQ